MRVTALLWGFAEATLFFVVPDVLISWVALERPRALVASCVLALAGALAGGTVMYHWSAADHERAAAAVERMPAVSPEMMVAVRSDLERRGAAAVFTGGFGGRPYKAYAVQAPQAELGWPAFATATVPARLARFALVALIVSAVGHALRGWPTGKRRTLFTGFWVLFYAVFWTVMPG